MGQQRLPLKAVLLYAFGLALFVAPLAARFYAQEWKSLNPDSDVMRAFYASLAATTVGWIGVALSFDRVSRRLGVEGLALIGLFSGLHFAVSYAARLAGSAAYALLGPFANFLSGPADEGIPCLLTAVLLTRLPYPGVVMLSHLSLFVLNGLFSGGFQVISLIFVSISILTHEVVLAIAGITTGTKLRTPASSPGRLLVLRMGLGIGLANALPLGAQFCLSMVLYRMEFDRWYIISVMLVAGFFYGSIGAGLGTLLGFRLRRVAL